jgi:hypothetical protein
VVGAELGVGLTAASVCWLVVNTADEPVMPTTLPA